MVRLFVFLWFGIKSLGLAWAAPQHGYSLYGSLKYGPGFKFFEYVNPQAPQGGELRIALRGGFSSLNPFRVQGEAAAGLGILYPSLGYATLMADSKDEIGSSYGYVAKAIEVDPDYKGATFHLRKEARFSDGTPLTAQDVAYSFQQLLAHGLPLYKAYYAHVLNAEVISPHRIRFNFSSPNRELPQLLGQFPIFSKTFYEKHGFEKSDLTIPPTSGPYFIKKVDAGSSITFEKNPHFWAKGLPVTQGLYNFQRVTYRYFQDENTLFEDFKAGNQDVRVEDSAKRWVEGYDFPAVKNKEIVKKEFRFKTPSPFQGLVFNLRKPFFQDIRIREALTLLLDFEFMNRAFFYGAYQRLTSYFHGSGLAAHGIPTSAELKIMEKYRGRMPDHLFTTAFSLPRNDGSGNIRPQLIKALKLFKEAGFVLHQKKLVDQETGKPFQFTILFASAGLEKVLQSYTANLKRVGIDVNLRLVDTSQYMRRVTHFDFDMIVGVLAQSLTPGNEQREFWLSSRADMPGARNWAGIKNPIIDDVVESLIQAENRQDLVNHAKVLDRLLLGNFYMIPLYTSTAMRLALRKTMGMPPITPAYGLEMDAWWFQSS